MKKLYIFEDSQQSTAGGGQKVSATLIDYLLNQGDVVVTIFDTVIAKDSFFRHFMRANLRRYWRPKLHSKSIMSSFTYTTGQSLIIIMATVLAGLRVVISMIGCSTSKNSIFYCPTKFGYLAALLPSLIFSCRLVMHVHNIAEKNLSSKLFFCLLRLTADKVICVSQTVYDSVEHPRKFLVRNPAPQPVAIRRPLSNELLSVGVVASFFPYKGHTFFLEQAVKLALKYRQLNIHLFGDGPEFAEISQRFTCKKVKFYGRIDSLDAIYSKLDVVVIPSLKPEAFSIVIPEAWSYGCLVLASDVPAHRELIQDGVNGMLFGVGDSMDLYRKLDDLIQDWPKRQHMISEGYNSIGQLELANFAPRLSKLIL